VSPPKGEGDKSNFFFQGISKTLPWLPDGAGEIGLDYFILKCDLDGGGNSSERFLGFRFSVIGKVNWLRYWGASGAE
jgi:hypothetical protein